MDFAWSACFVLCLEHPFPLSLLWRRVIMPADYCSVSYLLIRKRRVLLKHSALRPCHLSATHQGAQVIEANSQVVSSLMALRWLAHISGKASKKKKKKEAGILAGLLPLAISPAGQIEPNSRPEGRGRTPLSIEHSLKRAAPPVPALASVASAEQ